jgi:hypothetical protein
MGVMTNVHRALDGKLERNRLVGKPMRKWTGNIKTSVNDTECEVMDWVHLAQNKVQWRALVNTVMKLRIP